MNFRIDSCGMCPGKWKDHQDDIVCIFMFDEEYGGHRPIPDIDKISPWCRLRAVELKVLPDVCPNCEGTGAVDAPHSGCDPSCSECGGDGFIVDRDEFGTVWNRLACQVRGG